MTIVLFNYFLLFNVLNLYSVENFISLVFIQDGGKNCGGFQRRSVEKDLLNKLNIPCLDLETWGCPKYEQLKQTIVEPLASCGFHLNDNIYHCPMTECHAFWLWSQTYVM